MSLFEIHLKRGTRFFGTPTAARHASAQPQVELLEERACPSVAAPTGLQLTAISSTQVKLTWVNPAGSLGTDIYMWNGSSSSLIASVGKGVTTYTVNNLTPDQTQWFSVAAFDSTTTAQSAWVSVMTPAYAITAPSNVHVANATQTSVTLAWSNSTGATGYKIYEWNGTTAVLVGSTTIASPAFTVTGLSAGQSYYFYVQAYNADNSASSGWVSATAAGEMLAAPGSLKATAAGAGTIALSWAQSAGATGYRVYEWNGSSYSSAVLVASLGSSATGYQATGLLSGQTYWFYVQAYNALGSASSGWVSAATTAAAATLKAPTNLVAKPDGTSTASLSWTGATGAAGYNILVWEGTWVSVAVVPAGTTQYNVSGLYDFGTTWFMVEAFTAGYTQTTYSNEAFVTL